MSDQKTDKKSRNKQKNNGKLKQKSLLSSTESVKAVLVGVKCTVEYITLHYSKNVLRRNTLFIQNVQLNKCVHKRFLKYLICRAGLPAGCSIQVPSHPVLNGDLNNILGGMCSVNCKSPILYLTSSEQ